TKKAKDRYDQARAQAQSAEDKLKEVPEVKPDELDRLRQNISAKDLDIEKAGMRTKELERLKERAGKWFGLRQQHTSAEDKWAGGEKGIGGGGEIEAKGKRVALLDKNVPPLARLFEQRTAYNKAETEVNRLMADAEQHRRQTEGIRGRIDAMQSELDAGNTEQ